MAAELAALAADSRTVAVWTLVSRITGFGRVATAAAVLGPTYFGNLFQTSNALPGLVHELLMGSLVTAILVPPLVRCIDMRDRVAARELASGFLGVALLASSAVVVLSLIAGPLLLSFMTAGVDNLHVREQQRQLGWPLLAMLMPQIFFYGIAAIGVAVQNAYRRFALAAAAPALENVGIMAVMIASALMFGVGLSLDEITAPQILLLGLGSTAMVGLHAAIQWWGAYRVGVPLMPRAGWRDPEVRRMVRLSVPSSGSAALNCVIYFGLLIVAGAVPGGAVALQVGYNFFNFPLALCARPIATAQLPHLARSFDQDRLTAFRSTYRSSLALSMFVSIPISFLFFCIPGTLARAVSVGEMATVAGISLISATIWSMGAGVVGEAIFVVSTSACYARRDALSPFRATIIRAVVSFAGMALAMVLMRGTAVLWTLGLSLSAANLSAAAYLHWCQMRSLPKLPNPTGCQLFGDVAASAAAIAPTMFIVGWLEHVIQGSYRSAVAAVTALAVSGFLYLIIQWARGSSELTHLVAGLRGVGPGRPTSRLVPDVDGVEHKVEPPC